MDNHRPHESYKSATNRIESRINTLSSITSLQSVHRAAKIGTRPCHHNALDYLAGELVAALAALRRAILDGLRIRD